MPPSLDTDELQNEDLYGFLQVDPTADDKQIEKAYRKLALKWHPDKNPDNPKAVELFRKLVKVTALLKDKEARAAFDQLRRSRKVQEERRNQLNSERRKLREDLERREAAHAHTVDTERQAKENLAEKIARLKQEGEELIRASEQKLREEWAQKVEEAVTTSTAAASETSAGSSIVKVRWDKKSAAYSEEDIREKLSPFGSLAAVVVSPKGGRAVVEFESSVCAESAVQAGCDGLKLAMQTPKGESPRADQAPASPRPTAPSPPPPAFQPSPAARPAHTTPLFPGAGLGQTPPRFPGAGLGQTSSTFPAAKRKATEEEVFAMMRMAQRQKEQAQAQASAQAKDE